MKNVRNLFALFLLATALLSCESEVTVDDPSFEKIETISEDTGDQGNDPIERNG